MDIEGGLPKKRGAWTVCRFKRGCTRNRGWGEGLIEVDTPMHTVILMLGMLLFVYKITELKC